MKFTVIIVDDEELARKGVWQLLTEYPDIEVLTTCSNGLEAIDQINEQRPDVVFLDVQMPGINGFEVIASLEKPRPYIVFITAHDEFALKAFEVNAVDYLMKPFSDERFDQMVQKLEKALMTREHEEKIDNLIDQTKNRIKTSQGLVEAGMGMDRLIVKVDGKIVQLTYAEIRYIEAFDYYVKIHSGSEIYLVRESMKSMDEKLSASHFQRIHKSYIVNLKLIKEFAKAEDSGHEVTLTNGEVLKVSRSYKPALQSRLIY